LRNKLSIFCIIFFLCACAITPKYGKPVVSLPANNTTVKKADYGNIKWWKLFHDEKLDKLINEALKNNDNLKIAALKIKKAYELVKKSKANQLPVFELNLNESRTKSSENYYGSSTIYNDFSGFGTVSYEVDLWKKLENTTKYNISGLFREEFTKDALKLSIISNTALTYVALCSIDAQLHIAKKIIQKYKEIYMFREKQFKHGIINELVKEQANANYKSVKILIETLKENKVPLISALSLLTGESPEKLFNKRETLFNYQILSETFHLPPFIPSEILNNRPDIKAAEQALKAANFKIGIVKAAYFPSVFLTGLLGFQSNALHNLISFPSETWKLSGKVLQNLFDFGRINSNVTISKTEKEEAAIKYVKTVKTAFKEVYDSLNKIRILRTKISLEKDYLNSLKKILILAEKRFKAGAVDYLTVLNARQTLLTEKLNLTIYRKELLINKIMFFKALGCGYR